MRFKLFNTTTEEIRVLRVSCHESFLDGCYYRLDYTKKPLVRVYSRIVYSKNLRLIPLLGVDQSMGIIETLKFFGIPYKKRFFVNPSKF